MYVRCDKEFPNPNYDENIKYRSNISNENHQKMLKFIHCNNDTFKVEFVGCDVFLTCAKCGHLRN